MAGKLAAGLGRQLVVAEEGKQPAAAGVGKQVEPVGVGRQLVAVGEGKQLVVGFWKGWRFWRERQLEFWILILFVCPVKKIN